MRDPDPIVRPDSLSDAQRELIVFNHRAAEYFRSAAIDEAARANYLGKMQMLELVFGRDLFTGKD